MKKGIWLLFAILFVLILSLVILTIWQLTPQNNSLSNVYSNKDPTFIPSNSSSNNSTVIPLSFISSPRSLLNCQSDYFKSDIGLLLFSSTDVAMDSQGSIYYIDNGKSIYGISKIDKDNTFHEYWAKTSNIINSVAIEENDEIFSLAMNDVGISFYKFNSDGTFNENVLNLPELIDTRQLYISGTKIYLLDNAFQNEDKYGTYANDVLQIDADGNLINKYKQVGPGIIDLVFDSKGNIFTLNYGDTNNGHPSISMIVSDGTINKEWLDLPQGLIAQKLAIDSQDNLYIVYSGSLIESNPRYQIWKITPQKEITKVALKIPYPGIANFIETDYKDNIYIQMRVSALRNERNYLPSNPDFWSYIIKYDSSLSESKIVWTSGKDEISYGTHIFFDKDNSPVIFNGLTNLNSRDKVRYSIQRCN